MIPTTIKSNSYLSTVIDKEVILQKEGLQMYSFDSLKSLKELRTISSIVRNAIEFNLPEFNNFAEWKPQHSENTKERYKITLTAFFLWMYLEDAEGDYLNKYKDRTLDEDDLDLYHEYLVKRTRKRNFLKISVNTANSYLTAVRRFFKYMERKTRKDSKPFTNIAKDLDNISNKKLRSEKPFNKSALTIEQTKSLHSYCEEINPRNAFIIHLMLNQGLRVSSVHYLKAEDIKTEFGKIGAYVFEKGKTTIDEYGDPEDGEKIFKPFNEHTKKAYFKYIQTVDPKGEDPLFPVYLPNNTKQRLSHVSLRAIPKKAFIDLKIISKNGAESKLYTAHSLRHTFITNLRRLEASIEKAGAAAGHRSLESTLKYDQALDREDRIKNPIEDLLNAI